MILVTGTWGGEPTRVLIGDGTVQSRSDIEALLMTLVHSGTDIRDGAPPADWRPADPSNESDWVTMLESLPQWTTTEIDPPPPPTDPAAAGENMVY